MHPLLRLWTARVAPAFALDLRSLALFRFALGAVLFVDTLRRLADVTAFYTDLGVMPRAWAVETGGLWRLSLHLANGETWFQTLLILAQALAALALALGWRTRPSTFVAWLLTVSICNRNPLVLIGGDYLMCCLLFWSLFLPLAARWSVDAALATNAPPQDNRHLSWASAALVLQILSVYFFSALLKSGREWWPQMSAIYYALSLDSYAYAPGRWLTQYPGLMRALSGWVFWLELIGPPLMLLPLITRRLNAGIRGAVLLQLMLLHIGLVFTLAIGHFPFVSLASLGALIGGGFWDWQARRGAARAGTLRIYYDGDCGFCLKTCRLMRELLILPRATIQPAQEHRRPAALMQANHSWVVIDHDDTAHLKWSAFIVLLRRSPLLGWLGFLLRAQRWTRPGDAAYDFVARHRGRFAAVTARLLPERPTRFETGVLAQRLSAALMLATLAWNLATVQALPDHVMRWLRPPFNLLHLDQIWDMFAPYPLKDDGWWVAPGRLADGREIDVLRALAEDEDLPPVYDKPDDLATRHRNFRWHIYELRLWERRYAGHRQYWGRYLCRQWNGAREARAADRLLEFKLIYMLETTPPPGLPAVVEQRVLWRHDCFAPAGSSERSPPQPQPPIQP